MSLSQRRKGAKKRKAEGMTTDEVSKLVSERMAAIAERPEAKDQLSSLLTLAMDRERGDWRRALSRQVLTSMALMELLAERI